MPDWEHRPWLVGIGAQKARTTWLHDALARHPGIAPPPVKEMHYFDYVHVGNRALLRRREQMSRELKARIPDAVARFVATGEIAAEADDGRAMRFAFGDIGDDWYGGVFPQQGTGLDIAPAYSVLPRAGFEYMTRVVNDLRVFFVLRHPLDRILSQLRFRHRSDVREYQGRDLKTLSQADESELLALIRSSGVVARSDYAQALRHLWAAIPKKRCLLLFYDDLCRNATAVARKICTHAGLDPHRLPTPSTVRTNPTQPYDFSTKVLDEVHHVTKPLVEDLATLIDIPDCWRE